MATKPSFQTQSTTGRPTGLPGRSMYRGVLPSWIFSFWFHGLLLLVAAFGLRSCTGRGDRGESQAEWKTVGLVMRADHSESQELTDQMPEETTPQEPTTEQNPFETSTLPTLRPESVTQDSTAVPTAMPNDLPPVLGPGSGMPAFAEPSAEETAPLRIARTPIPASGLARGETDFFGIRTSGQRFVYVIDVSGSMASPPTAIASAKAALLASLATLSPDQSFQVIFFNERPHLMPIKGLRAGEMIPASDINRTLTRQQVAAVEPALGTQPLPALRMAMEMKPDVIFFLTDAKESGLSPRELADITRANGGAARIHAIEFGKGDRLGRASNLERLAEQNGGRYEYQDVNRF